MEAAFDRIAEKGFEGLRLREVATAAGIDHSTLHHYFATKQDLIAAVVDHATGQFWMAAPPERAGAASTLEDHLTMLGRMIQQRPALFAVLRELDLRGTRDPAVRAILDNREAGWRTALAARLQRSGWPDGPDAATSVELVIAVAKGVSLTPQRAVEVFGLLHQLLTRQGARR